MQALVRRLRCLFSAPARRLRAGQYGRDRSSDDHLPDSNLAQALNLRIKCKTSAKASTRRHISQKMLSAKGRASYSRRKATVEPVFSVIKQQGNMCQFRNLGLYSVRTDFTLAIFAYTLT